MTHIYLDHGATTPVHPQVVEAMLPYWTEIYGNPVSGHHHGRLANRALSQARQTIADLLHASPDEIVFTGAGSESDNLALRGVLWAARANGRGNHLITSAIEHKAVGDTARQLRDQFGFELTILPVDSHGRIDLVQLEAAIRPETALISLMAANNEIGTFQPFLEAAAIARQRGIWFHTDAVQAAPVINWDLSRMPIDLMSLAPHKFYGPKGIGILYVRQGIELLSTLTGGGQEEGRRAGTVNVPYAVGAAEALRLAMDGREANISHYQALRDRLIDGLLQAVPEGCVLTGHPRERLPHNASFAFRGVSGNDLLIHLDVAGVSASSGSACATGNPKPSPVLQALGLADDWCKGGLRFTVGQQNTAAEIDYVVQLMPGVLEKIRAYSGEFV